MVKKQSSFVEVKQDLNSSMTVCALKYSSIFMNMRIKDIIKYRMPNDNVPNFCSAAYLFYISFRKVLMKKKDVVPMPQRFGVEHGMDK